MAFFQFEVTPAWLVRCRRGLPRTFNALTRTIWTLFARGSATTVYWLSFSPWRVPFSVRRTVLTISKEFMAKSVVLQTRLDLFKCTAREHELVAAQNFIGIERVTRGQLHARNVPRGSRQVLVQFVGNNQRRAVQLQRRQHAHKFLRFAGGQLQIIQHQHIPGAEAFREGFTQRKLLRRARNFFAEITRLGAEHHATTAPKR